jgi:hypothetical protein
VRGALVFTKNRQGTVKNKNGWPASSHLRDS